MTSSKPSALTDEQLDEQIRQARAYLSKLLTEKTKRHNARVMS